MTGVNEGGGRADGPRYVARRPATWLASALAASVTAASAWLAGAHPLGVAAVALATAFALGRAAAAAAAARATQAALAVEQRRGDAARLLALELGIDRIRSVLDSLGEGVIVTDSAGEIVLANPCARLALRDAAATAIGRTLWEVLPDKLAECARRAHQLLADEPGGGDRTARFSSLPVGDRVFDLTAVRVRSRQSGQDFGTVFLFVDATRSHELALLKDRFLSSISHELRTPLTNICAYAEILRQLVPGDCAEWPDFVRIVHEEGLQLSRTVDAVFDYLQLASGDARFRLEAVDGAQLVGVAASRAQARADGLGVALSARCEPSVPQIEVDKARFEQVCSQLIDNGLKFTPRGGQVRVSVCVEEGNFCLRVDDSGPGVPGGERLTVFEKFSQLHDHMTDKPSGAGLGLATCRAIVARLGGMIWCEESRLGGAGFVVVFPPASGPKLPRPEGTQMSLLG